MEMTLTSRRLGVRAGVAARLSRSCPGPRYIVRHGADRPRPAHRSGRPLSRPRAAGTPLIERRIVRPLVNACASPECRSWRLARPLSHLCLPDRSGAALVGPHGGDLPKVALGRVNIFRGEHPTIPLVVARDGTTFKRRPNLLEADLEPAGAEQARHEPDR